MSSQYTTETYRPCSKLFVLNGIPILEVRFQNHAKIPVKCIEMFLFSNLFSPCSKNHIYEKQTWNLFCVYFFFFFFFHHCSFCWSCMLAKSREHWYDKQKKTWIQSTKNKGEYSIKICLKKKKKEYFFFPLKNLITIWYASDPELNESIG